jgi:hypothetical protein
MSCWQKPSPTARLDDALAEPPPRRPLLRVLKAQQHIQVVERLLRIAATAVSHRCASSVSMACICGPPGHRLAARAGR